MRTGRGMVGVVGQFWDMIVVATRIVSALGLFTVFFFFVCATPISLIFRDCPDVPEGHWTPCTDAYDDEHLGEPFNQYFGSVGLTSFTLYRCFYEADCTALEGVPLQIVWTEIYTARYRRILRLAYVAISFVFQWALFNVVTALVIHEADVRKACNPVARKEKRDQAALFLAMQIEALVKAISAVHSQRIAELGFSEAGTESDPWDIPITHAGLKAAFDDPLVGDMLRDLDLDIASCEHALVQVLFPDRSTSVSLCSIINPLCRLCCKLGTAEMLSCQGALHELQLRSERIGSELRSITQILEIRQSAESELQGGTVPL